MKATFLLLSSYLLSACTSDNASTSNKSSPQKLVLGVIPKGTTHEFWKSVHAGALKAAHEINQTEEAGARNVPIEIIWKGPLKEDNREEQIKVVEDLIARGVTGIVLAPLDDAALYPAVRDAVRERIPVVVIDSGLKGEEHTSFVATDNYRGGALAAQELAMAVSKQGRVLVLRYAEGSQSTMERERGFLDEIAKYPEIEVVSSNQYAGVTTELAYAASENLIAPYRGPGGEFSIQGIFTPCEPVTFGMLRALQEAGLAGKVALIGFDSSEKMIAALEQGELHALVLQDPIKIGYLGVKALHQALSGGSPPRIIDTGVTVVTKRTMHDPMHAALLRPDYATWLK